MADQPDATPVLIRAVRPDDDLDAQLDLAERSFGPGHPAGRDQRRRAIADPIAAGRSLGAFDGDRPVGAAIFHDMRQWWWGRAVPMAGVASVKVAPEDRGRGVARRLMTALLDQVAARGYPLSALYPATRPLYRSLGWELAGVRETAMIPARSLRDLVPPDPIVLAGGQDAAAGSARLRRAAPADAEAVISVIGRVHQAARDCGPITWDVASVAGWLTDPARYAYLCDDGFLIYRWHNGNDALFVEGAEAISAPAQRAFWAHVGSHASIADQVFARVGPADVFWRLTRERDADVHHRSMWMLRVIDAPAAIAARGFPAGVSLTVPLAIHDDARPANSGRWALTVTDGRGALDPLTPPAARADPSLTLGARGLAALYAGTPVAALRQAGLAAGGSPVNDALLDTAFAGTAYMLDAF
ncbi:MAG: GNAT family N-acetyltransferase [Streptosporangiaceae bacterium]